MRYGVEPVGWPWQQDSEIVPNADGSRQRNVAAARLHLCGHTLPTLSYAHPSKWVWSATLGPRRWIRCAVNYATKTRVESNLAGQPHTQSLSVARLAHFAL